MSTAEWTLEVALDAAVDCIERHLPGYLSARLAEDALRARPLLNGHLPMPKVVTTGMIDDLAADWVTPAIFLNATSTSYQNYNASSLLDSQPRITATVLLAEGDVNTSEQRIYSNALSMYSDGVRFILSTIFPQDGGCEVGVNAATPDSVQYSPVVRPDGYSVWLRWSEVSVVWTQRVNNYWQTEPPTPPPFDPLSLDPLAWWDAADESTLFVDAAGTVPAIAGDPIGRWVSKGVAWYAGTATQTVSANRPLLGTGYVEFSLLANTLNTLFAGVDYPVEIVCVINSVGTGIGNRLVYGNRYYNGAPEGFFFGGYSSSGVITQARSAGVTQNASYPSASYQEWQIARSTITTADVAQEATGGSPTTQTWSPALTSPAGTAAMRIGGGSNAGPMRIKEMFVFDRVLTPSERAQLYAYLEAKHGI